MITLTNTGSAIKFTFDGNSMYLQDGTIEVPFNSLTLVTDNSGMATFKKSATNDIFISATYDELGMTKSQLETWFKDNACSTSGGGGIPSGDVQTMIDQSISGMADNASYDSVSQEIKFYNGRNEVYSVDASDFVIDGMIDDVRIETISGVTYLVIDFNTASGKEDIQIPLTDIFDPSNYYTKTEVDQAISGKADSSAVYTKSEVDDAISAATDDMATQTWVGEQGYITSVDLSNYATNDYVNQSVSGKADTSAVTEAISAATSGKADSNSVYTKAETDNAISAATSGKVDTSAITTSVTSASTDSEIPTAKAVYDAIPTSDALTKAPTSFSRAYDGQGRVLLQAINGGFAVDSTTIAATKINNNEIISPYYGRVNIPVNISLVETSAVTSAITSASTNSEVAGAKAVYDALSGIGGGISSGEAQTMIDESISGKADSSTVSTLSGEVSDMGEVTARALVELQANKVDTSAITTSVTSASTDSEIPSAKAVYDAIPTGTSITIDPSLDSGSTNAVANSAITTALNDTVKLSNVGTYYIENFDSYDGKLATSFHKFSANNIVKGYSLWYGKINNQYVCKYADSNINPSGLMDLSLVETSAITTSVTSASTDVQVPSAKAVYDALQEGGGGGGGNATVELTQAEYDALVTAGTVSADTYYIITDAQSVDISQYWTSAQTTSAITEAVSGKVNTSSIVTAITSGSTDSQVPSAKAVYDTLGGLKLQQITQADYDALVQAGTVDASTLYIITNVVS